MAITNSGTCIIEIIERVECERHGVPQGVPCWSVPKNVSSGFGRYAAICGLRIREAGFNGKVSSLSMQSKSALNASVAKRQIKESRRLSTRTVSTNN